MKQHPEAGQHMQAAAALATFEPILCGVAESVGGTKRLRFVSALDAALPIEWLRMMFAPDGRPCDSEPPQVNANCRSRRKELS